MKWIMLFMLMTSLCLTNCFEGANKQKEEILLLNNSKDARKAVESYFEKEKIEYKYWRGKIESSRIGELVNNDESVYFAIYREEKDVYIITHYVVYIIIDSNNKIKDIIFDTLFTGP